MNRLWCSERGLSRSGILTLASFATLAERLDLRGKFRSLVQEENASEALRVFQEINEYSTYSMNEDFLMLLSKTRGVDFTADVFLSYPPSEEQTEKLLRLIVVRHSFLPLAEKIVEKIPVKTNSMHWTLFREYCTSGDIDKATKYLEDNPDIQIYPQFLVPYIRLLISKNEIQKAMPFIHQIQQEEYNNSNLVDQFRVELFVFVNQIDDAIERLIEDGASSYSLRFILQHCYNTNKEYYKLILDTIRDNKLKININVIQTVIQHILETGNYKDVENLMKWSRDIGIFPDFFMIRAIAVHYLRNNELHRYKKLESEYRDSFIEEWEADQQIQNLAGLHLLLRYAGKSIIEKEM